MYAKIELVVMLGIQSNVLTYFCLYTHKTMYGAYLRKFIAHIYIDHCDVIKWLFQQFEVALPSLT